MTRPNRGFAQLQRIREGGRHHETHSSWGAGPRRRRPRRMWWWHEHRRWDVAEPHRQPVLPVAGFHAALGLCLAIVTGCGVNDTIDKAIKEIQNTSNKLQDQSADWQRLLTGLEETLKQDVNDSVRTAAARMEGVIQNATSYAGSEVNCR